MYTDVTTASWSMANDTLSLTCVGWELTSFTIWHCECPFFFKTILKCMLTTCLENKFISCVNCQFLKPVGDAVTITLYLHLTVFSPGFLKPSGICSWHTLTSYILKLSFVHPMNESPITHCLSTTNPWEKYLALRLSKNVGCSQASCKIYVSQLIAVKWVYLCFFAAGFCCSGSKSRETKQLYRGL